MTAKRFREWQSDMGWSATETAKRLGLSKYTIANYRSHGVPPRVARMVGLAMAALSHRLEAVS